MSLTIMKNIQLFAAAATVTENDIDGICPLIATDWSGQNKTK